MNFIDSVGCEIPYNHCIKFFADNKTFVQEYNGAKIFPSRKKPNFRELSIKYDKKHKTKVLETFVNSILTKKKHYVEKQKAFYIKL